VPDRGHDFLLSRIPNTILFIPYINNSKMRPSEQAPVCCEPFSLLITFISILLQKNKKRSLHALIHRPRKKTPLQDFAAASLPFD